MLDKSLFAISEQMHKKIKAKHESFLFNPTKTPYEEFVQRNVEIKMPYLDFASYCMDSDDGPYNPDNQTYYMRVYCPDDTLTKEEFNQFNKYHQVQYMLYHKWKKGEVTKKQLKDFDWLELFIKHR